MKKTILAIALGGALIAPFAFAGPGGGPNLDRMADRLDLTDAQQAQIEEIFEQHRTQRDQMREQHREEVRAVLTDEQKAKLDELRANRPYRDDCPRFSGKGGQGGGYGPRGDW